jgi:hypothetical protein
MDVITSLRTPSMMILVGNVVDFADAYVNCLFLYFDFDLFMFV